MNSGDKPTGSSSSSRGNGGKKKKTKQDAPKEPQRGMGVAKLEKMRLSALNNNPYHQVNFGGLGGGSGMKTATNHNPVNPNASRSYGSIDSSNNARAVQQHFAQQAMGGHTPTSSPPPRERYIELDLLGKRERKEEGAASGDEEIDLELRL
uniref:Uncharacterized protein n=1 Tax=Kalanchoe fedtschenkoi TaxID=63787 RepID=A0A7N0T513_KALFE